ncbi:MAG: TonB-dependent receptor [Pseudoflavonifractor sp.]|nr:TonB-dependent receptor [Alloprevotella sp.]MCM1117650.1 TonB-dependent receptor [Pseudoflavonifractor sp.]
MIKPLSLILTILSFAPAAIAQEADPDSLITNELDEVVVKSRAPGLMRIAGAETGFQLGQTELFRAACCNLGESFTTNASVDVDYADPATGAKQIKLLGLSGSYVQMMTENLPAFRGAAMPYAFRYVPGPWMKSIRVSKGSSTVKNGYEPITGQIDVEYLKPQDDRKVHLNTYLDTDLRMELNADANLHLTDKLNAELLAHYEDRFKTHDGNHDGFADMPAIRQVNLMTRWNYFGPSYIFHGGLSAIDERSEAGQRGKHFSGHDPYLIDTKTRRYEGYMKHAFVLNREQNMNVALAANASMHQLDATYGHKLYGVNEKSAYAQLMFESDFTEAHNLSAGLSLNYDYLGQRLRRVANLTLAPQYLRERETTPGAYAQYTFKLGTRLTAMAGVRADHSSVYGWFATPRFNIRYSPLSGLTFKASAGKGYRTVHPWAEYNYLLASGREMVVENLRQEAAWNFGISADYLLTLGAQSLRFSLEYFHTRFDRQAVVDYDSSPDKLTIASLRGKSYSNVAQAELTFQSSFGLSATAAFRLNDVKTTYSGSLMEKALTSKYKALLTLSWKDPLEIWQADATFVMNGGGRLPAPYRLDDGSMSWGPRFKAFPSLNMQVTRWWRHISVYIGGENLTGFRQKNPIVNASNPWSEAFDPTVVWGPVNGTMGYAGIRLEF